jgi:hypothetical protein
MLCTKELLIVQAKILECREDCTLAKEAQKKLEAHERKLEPAIANWQAEGGLPLDFWCDE